MLELVLMLICFVSTINSDPSFSSNKDAADSPLLLSTSAAFLGSKLRFPELVRPLTYNVTVPLGATARLPCTVTNVEHQAVRRNILLNHQIIHVNQSLTTLKFRGREHLKIVSTKRGLNIKILYKHFTFGSNMLLQSMF